MDFDYRSTDFEALGLPTHCAFNWQYKPAPKILTPDEAREEAQKERNRKKSRERSVAYWAAKREANAPRALDSRGRATVGIAPRTKQAITITSKPEEVARSARLKKGASI